MQAVPNVGTILLGKYRVERVLGRGGMGVVVAARHETLGELYAIKLMLPAALELDDARERFVREARAAARLRSEHVARVHDVGTLDNGVLYMLMEHLTGEDLKHILDKRGALPVEEAAHYVVQVCEAVAEAHSLGIVHRDLKPANLFLTYRPNGTPCVKVLDFGISKEINTGNVGPALTKTGMAVGTPMYMSPEQVAHSKLTDVRSDIWALGIILYELVTGKPPFYADGIMELIAQVLTNPPVPLSQMRPEIPAAFDALVLRCLEKKAEQRFATVRDLMVALLPFATPAKPNLLHPAGGIPNSLPAPREEIKDATTVEMVKGTAAAPPPAPTVYGTPMLSTVPLRPSLPGAESERAKPPILEEKTGSGQTGRAWGGTQQIFASGGKKPKLVIAVAITAGALLLVGILLGTMVTRLRSGSGEEAPLASGSTDVDPESSPGSVPEPPVPDRALLVVVPDKYKTGELLRFTVQISKNPLYVAVILVQENGMGFWLVPDPKGTALPLVGEKTTLLFPTGDEVRSGVALRASLPLGKLRTSERFIFFGFDTAAQYTAWRNNVQDKVMVAPDVLNRLVDQSKKMGAVIVEKPYEIVPRR